MRSHWFFISLAAAFTLLLVVSQGAFAQVGPAEPTPQLLAQGWNPDYGYGNPPDRYGNTRDRREYYDDDRDDRRRRDEDRRRDYDRRKKRNYDHDRRRGNDSSWNSDYGRGWSDPGKLEDKKKRIDDSDDGSGAHRSNKSRGWTNDSNVGAPAPLILLTLDKPKPEQGAKIGLSPQNPDAGEYNYGAADDPTHGRHGSSTSSKGKSADSSRSGIRGDSAMTGAGR